MVKYGEEIRIKVAIDVLEGGLSEKTKQHVSME
ncbi:hypothetical protein GMA19_00486 [Paenibacillus polymyxa E681]|nr:hypothetical protein PPE_05100 [Paenibacillus polymyxa E681]QNV55337.1 hypothetical protein GE561_00487 [Paenibacillus polymyxa E681]QNV60173.1 hypothetical protein GMA19_00486 [Paenibacillus polymyxa E681]